VKVRVVEVDADTPLLYTSACSNIPPEHGNLHFFSADRAECARIESLIGFDPNYTATSRRRPPRSISRCRNLFTACTASGTRVPTRITAASGIDERYRRRLLHRL
jgi:hypothetical protein